MAYAGPERRRKLDNDEALMMLARIDERVKHIDEKLDDHIASHDKRGGRIAEWASIAVALAVGLFGIVKGK